MKSPELFTGSLVWLTTEGDILDCNDNFNTVFLEEVCVEEKHWSGVDILFTKKVFASLGERLRYEDCISWRTELFFGNISKKAVIKAVMQRYEEEEIFCFQIQTSIYPDFLPTIKEVLKEKFVGFKWNFKSGEFEIDEISSNLMAILELTDRSFLNLYQMMDHLLKQEEKEELKQKIKKTRRTGQTIIVTWQHNGELFKLKIVADEELEDGKGIKGLIISDRFHINQASFSKVIYNFVRDTKQMFWLLDSTFTIRHVNPQVMSILQFTKEDLLGTKIFQYDLENEHSNWVGFTKDLLEKVGEPLRTTFKRKNKKVFPVELNIYPFNEKDEEFFIVSGEDITSLLLNESRTESSLAQSEFLSYQLEAEKAYLLNESLKDRKFENIITVSPAYNKLLSKIQMVAKTETTVLIEGETGTGKELLARAIHEFSSRSKKAMIIVNCGNLPRELIESELFGHERGSFTGAEKRKIGRFELANQSTIFLDEIGELPLELQSRLLRVLQEGSIQRIGSEKCIQLDLRVVAATNRDLKSMVEEKTFRSDLYYRLNVFPLHNIPLRERKEDIKVLSKHFVEKYSRKMNKNIEHISTSDIKKLENYPFPGNIRELENIIERSVILTAGDTLTLDFWPSAQLKSDNNGQLLTLEESQKEHIIKALNETKWRISGDNGAAKLLGLKDQTLFSKMRKLAINRE